MSKMKKTSKISQGGVEVQATTGLEGQANLKDFIEQFQNCKDEDHVFAIYRGSKEHNLIMNAGTEFNSKRFVVEFTVAFINDDNLYQQFKSHVELLNIIIDGVDAFTNQKSK